MSNAFGPWSTAMHNHLHPQLSTFWKRRMGMLAQLRLGAVHVSRQSSLLLVAFALLAAALPTLRLTAAQAEKSPQQGTAKPSPSRIYSVAFLRTRSPETGKVLSSAHAIIVIDPETAQWKKLVDGEGTARVSRDGQTLLFRRGDAIWNCDTKEAAAPGRISDANGLPVWSPDSKAVLVSKYITLDGDEKRWRHETFRIPAAGGEATPVPIPDTDGVQDWSPDGKWVVTESNGLRPEKPRYRLFVMRLDGNEERRITKLGYHPRFSPDSRWVAYCHDEKGVHSIRVVDLDGNHERTVLAEEGLTWPNTSCWSPDGKQLAITLQDNQILADGSKAFGPPDQTNSRIAIIDADGKNRRELWLTAQDNTDPITFGRMDWR